MKNKRHFYVWIFTFCLLTVVGIIMAAENHKVPVTITPPDNEKLSLSRSEVRKIKSLIRRYFKIDAPDSPYGEVKVEISGKSSRDEKHLTVYLMYRKIYLVDVVQLTVNKNYKIVDVNEAPLL